MNSVIDMFTGLWAATSQKFVVYLNPNTTEIDDINWIKPN